MRRRQGPNLMLGLACSALVLAGCSRSGPESAGPEGSGAEGAPASGITAGDGDGTGLAFARPDADDVNKRLESEADLVDVHAAEILAVDATDPQQLVVSFEMGSHHCHGVTATATESDTMVTVSLWTGRRPGVAPTACTYGVFPYTTAVPLQTPLGDRAVATAGSGADGTDPGQPTAVDEVGTVAGPDDVDRYLGRHVEDGVEWALANERSWRVLSLDGERLDDGGPPDPERLSFTVVADVIVALEWS